MPVSEYFLENMATLRELPMRHERLAPLKHELLAGAVQQGAWSVLLDDGMVLLFNLGD